MPKINETTKHIVCYSGGHSSALVALAVAERFGTRNLVLLNHDINSNVEDADIKRFKQEVAATIGVKITYANHPHIDTMDQFDVCIEGQAFKVGVKNVLCTHRLKTQPFMKWLEANVPDKNCVVYYGFDANERHRIQRRAGILGGQGYQTDYPLALWGKMPRSVVYNSDADMELGRKVLKGENIPASDLVQTKIGEHAKRGPFRLTVLATEEVGIERPLGYSKFKHANCIGCIKAGRQHWYIVYCERPDIWAKAKHAEDVIGYSILRNVYLDELEEMFEIMKLAGVEPTEHIPHQRFWTDAKRVVAEWKLDQFNAAGVELSTTCHLGDEIEPGQGDEKPCECVF